MASKPSAPPVKKDVVPKKRMTTRSAKNKGARLQNFIRDLFRLLYYDTLDIEDIESRPMGNNGTDLILTPAAKKLIKFDVECKNVEKLNILEAYQQASANSTADRIPIVFHKKNRTDIYATLSLQNLLILLYPDKNIDEIFKKVKQGIQWAEEKNISQKSN